MKNFNLMRRWMVFCGMFIAALSGSIPSHGATLLWDPNPVSEGVTHYTVTIESDAGSLPPALVTTTSFSLDGLMEGVDYTISVTAHSPFGASYPSTIEYSLALALAPAITRQPDSKAAVVGEPLDLSVEVTGTPPFFYQWLKNEVVLPAQTNQTFFIPETASADQGTYTVRITNAVASVWSAPATVTMLTPPSILQQPADLAVPLQGHILLTVQAAGSSPLAHQWYKNGQRISGATGSSYQILSANPDHAGSYFARVTNPAGSVQSDAVNVTVLAPPTIAVQPQSITGVAGARVALAVGAEGSPPLTYRWYRNGVEIPGRTTAFLVISSASIADEGTYYVRVSNAHGSVESHSATISIAQTGSTRPAIISHPSSRSLAVGAAYTLEVLATGTGPLAYQWFKDGTLIEGESRETLALSNVSVEDTGNYTVTVSNSAGAVTSIPAIISVLVAPDVTKQLAGTNIVSGGTLILRIEATGSLPLTCQWYKNGQLIVDQSGETLTISPVTANDAGTYLVNVSNDAGSINSAVALVTVFPGAGISPRIVTQPMSIILPLGDPGQLFVEADGQELNYQWFKDGAALPGQTNSILSITSALKSDEGIYTARISNRFGTVTSGGATVSVISLPRILRQPSETAIVLGLSFELSIVAVSEGTLQYQWLKNGAEIPGATTPTYRMTSAQANHIGIYRVRVSNSFGSILSEEASVAWAVPPQITRPLAPITVSEGAELRLSLEAAGTRPFAVQWLRDGILVALTDETELVIARAQVGDNGMYVARITGPGGVTESAPAKVTIAAKPVITMHPQSAALDLGATVMLTVSASGNGTLTYQWFKDGQPLSQGKNVYYRIGSVTETDYGRYSVRVANAAGFTESNAALIERFAAPGIERQPASIELLEGSPGILSVTAVGTSPLHFQWHKDGKPVLDGTNAVLEWFDSDLDDAGVYHVVVTNALGSVESARALVQVMPGFMILRHPASTNIPLGAALELSVQASSINPLEYQWFHNGQLLPESIFATLLISAASLADAGNYWVVINDAGQEHTTETAQVGVNLNPSHAGGMLTISAGGNNIAASLNIFAQGVPLATYDIQVTGDLQSRNWITIQTVVADEDGRFEIRPPGTQGGYWFVRTVRR